MEIKPDENSLFSIDIESYLYKAAVFSQRSALLYTTELTRTAFKRGADNIRILLEQKKVEISDDGRGIDPVQLNMLADLKSNVPVEKKESAIRKLRGDHGAGLLAVFAPGPKSILIETVFNGTAYSLTINADGAILEEGGSINTGSRILLNRKSRDLNREKKIFLEYSRWAGKKIILNGVEIIPDKMIPDTLVSVKIKSSGSIIRGICGIPASGGICRVWFTGNGILRKKIDFPPFRGLIFSAVIESESPEPEDVLSGLVPYVHTLYHYLCNNYTGVRSDQRDRIEELIYLHRRKTGEKKFTESIKPFRVSNSNTYIGLSELIKLSSSGKLYVINSENKISDQSENTAAYAIELSPRQIDFVMNQLRIPAKFVDPKWICRTGFSYKILIKFQFLIFNILSRFRMFSRRLSEDLLWNEEKGLISRLNESFRNDAEIIEKGYSNIEFSIIKCFGFSPLYLKTGHSGTLNIQIRRGSRMIRKIVKLNDSDERNFELIRDFIKTELRALSVI